MGLQYEDVEFQTTGEATLRGWYVLWLCFSPPTSTPKSFAAMPFLFTAALLICRWLFPLEVAFLQIARTRSSIS